MDDSPLKIAIYQAENTKNSERFLEQVRLAAEHNATLIVFPECFFPGYPVDPAPFTVSPISHEEIVLIAGENKISICYGYIDSTSTGFLNSVDFISADGPHPPQRILQYSKLHTGTWGVESGFKRGSSLPKVVKFHGINISVVICYDMYFPELFRYLKLQGVELVIAIWASTVPGSVAAFSQSRALENEIAILSVNYAQPFAGGSIYVDNRGEVQMQLGSEVGLKLVDVHIHDVRKERQWDPRHDITDLLIPF